MGRLEGKVAVITGASSGIGRATAIRFAGEGAAVVLADLNQEGGESAVRACKENGGRAVFQKTDVCAGEEVKAAIDRAVREFGKLDTIFNNAGLAGAVGTIDEITFENWDMTMAVLLRAVFAGMKYAVPEMRKAGGGSIISTASVAGLRGGAGPHPYSAAKAAVINLTRSVALEVGKDRIRVNCICPGGINTPLISGRIPGGEETAAQVLALIQPIPRAGRPDDIANMALFLASDEAEWITGAAMVVDGGMTAGGTVVGNNRPTPPAVPGNFAGPSYKR
ncbi:MAG TPA: SDR family NAD(P)-dependent oxidoreductase [Candidatus Binataceae bacterium]|nr:SDR family NAD(P)-dependent oxidoreductase [Candidatus Binataceae bacterium]